MFQRFLCLIIGYALGCILTAEIVSYYKSNKRIRTMGSGNPGMTNTIKVYGLKCGGIVLAGDLMKTVTACILAYLLFPLPNKLAILYAGLGSAIGHNFPFWNGFHGGRGVACTCISLFCFSPFWGLTSCIIGLISCLLTKYLAIGSIVIPTVFLLISFFRYKSIEIYILCAVFLIMMIYTSGGGIIRIIKGTEKKALWFDK